MLKQVDLVQQLTLASTADALADAQYDTRDFDRAAQPLFWATPWEERFFKIIPYEPDFLSLSRPSSKTHNCSLSSGT